MFPVMPFFNFHDEAINLMRFSGNNTAYWRSKSGSRGKRKKNMLHVPSHKGETQKGVALT